MKKTKWLTVYLVSAIFFVSCIQDEAPNAECDILKSFLQVDNVEDYFFSSADAVQEVSPIDSVIIFRVKNRADLTHLSPEFTLTEGATIEPASGTPQDFSREGVYYTVTSEDRVWSRKYLVRFSPQTRVISDTISYKFSNFSLEPNSKYYVWFDRDESGNPLYNWATGNPGYRLSKSSALPDEYPTVPYSLSGDTVVKLITRDTGAFGALANMRIAAGNLFIGSFDVSFAIKDAMKATKFGIPFDKKPIRLTGRYQYTPGAVYQDKSGKVVVGKVDSPDIYAVFYRNSDETGNPVVLYGDDVLTHPNIVALARLTNPQTGSTWLPFELTFDYENKMEFQKNILEEFGYSLAIVFASSIDGAIFHGAVGSELLISNVQLICDSEK